MTGLLFAVISFVIPFIVAVVLAGFFSYVLKDDFEKLLNSAMVLMLIVFSVLLSFIHLIMMSVNI